MLILFLCVTEDRGIQRSHDAYAPRLNRNSFYMMRMVGHPMGHLG